MKTMVLRTSVGILAAATLVLGAAWGAFGAVIIQDTFTGTSTPPDPIPAQTPNTLNNRVPSPVNLPGGAWTGGFGWGSGLLSGGTLLSNYTGTAYSPAGPSADDSYGWLGADTYLRYDVTQGGSYTPPGSLVISADLNLGWDTSTTRVTGVSGTANNNQRGLYLGYSAGTAFNSLFYGLALQSNGDLYLHEGSTIASPNITGTLSWTGPAFDPSAWHHLSYKIDTATGAISEISLDSQTYTAPATSTFTPANTTAAAIIVNSDGGWTWGYFDNFLLEEAAIPEPSAVALIGLGALLLWRRARQRMPG